jgi:hypothetical protein
MQAEKARAIADLKEVVALVAQALRSGVKDMEEMQALLSKGDYSKLAELASCAEDLQQNLNFEEIAYQASELGNWGKEEKEDGE